MNKKSIDKMKGLLKNARDTSLWWEKNKKSAERYALAGKTSIQMLALLSIFMALGGALWIVGSGSVLMGVVKGVTLFAGFGGLGYMCNGLLNIIHNRVAKKFEDGYILCGFDYMDEIQWSENEDAIEDILRTAHSIRLSDVQKLCPHLEKLRNASLPRSWWRQMKLALENLEIPENTVWKDNSHELLEQVYIEMSEQPASNTNVGARVLKL